MGVLQLLGSTVAISLKLFKRLKITGHPVSDFRTSGFPELSSAEQILALCIG
jgi:hypothetical protein